MSKIKIFCPSCLLRSYLSCYFFIILITLVATSCKKNAPPPPKEKIPSVTVITTKEQTVPAIFEYIGVAQSSHQVEIRARVEGYLDGIFYQEGEIVQQNDLLFKIDPKPFEAALAESKAIAEQQEAVLWEAERALERYKPLYTQKAASLRDLDNATAQVMSAKASLDAAKAKVIQAELNLGYTTIRSPINGLSNQAKYRQGALVGPNSEQSLLTTIYATDPIWVNFNVPEGEILKYSHESKQGRFKFPDGMQFIVEVELSNGETLPSQGTVDFANPALDQNTGTMSVRGVLPNPQDILKPGQFVRARVKGAEYLHAIIIPQQAVMQGGNGLFVYVVNKEGIAEMRPIVPGDWYENQWIIQEGLKAGEQVITDGVNKVLSGMKVNIENKIESNS